MSINSTTKYIKFIFLVYFFVSPFLVEAKEFVEDFREIPNNGVNTFIIDGQTAGGGLIGPSLTRDGLTMYYARFSDSKNCYHRQGASTNIGTNICWYADIIADVPVNIWFATRSSTDDNAVWSNPTMLPSCSNSNCVNSGSIEKNPQISRWDDGSTLYFNSYRTGQFKIYSAVKNPQTGQFEVLNRNEFANIDATFTMQLSIALSPDGHYLAFTGWHENSSSYKAAYSQCESWDSSLNKCALWGSPILISAFNNNLTNDPLLNYINTRPGYSSPGAFGFAWDANMNYLYATWGAMSGIVALGDFIVRLKNNGPGVNFSNNLVEVATGDINGVKNYTTTIMKNRKYNIMDWQGRWQPIDGSTFQRGWYVEVPFIWENPNTGSKYIFAHNNTKIWFGKIVESSLQCYNDVDCEDGNFCDGYEICNNHVCQAGTPPNCDDGSPKTIDTCDELNDTCVHTPITDTTPPNPPTGLNVV